MRGNFIIVTFPTKFLRGGDKLFHCSVHAWALCFPLNLFQRLWCGGCHGSKCIRCSVSTTVHGLVKQFNKLICCQRVFETSGKFWSIWIKITNFEGESCFPGHSSHVLACYLNNKQPFIKIVIKSHFSRGCPHCLRSKFMKFMSSSVILSNRFWKI